MRREQLPCFWHVGSGEGEREGEERRGGDVEEKFETLVEANDLLLERVVRTIIIECRTAKFGSVWHNYIRSKLSQLTVDY